MGSVRVAPGTTEYSTDKISGYATLSVHEVNTAFPVDGWEYTGWGKCTGQQGSWADVDAYCRYNGYSGAVPVEENPCYHEPSGSRWGWDGKSPMVKTKETGPGWALTKVQCYSAPRCDPACPSGYTCEADNVCRKGGRTCTESGDSGKDYDTKGTVVDTQTFWEGYQWRDGCEGNTLIEFYCSNDNVELERYTCPNGCDNGVCKSAPRCDPACPSGYTCEADNVCRKGGKTCTETDPRKDYFTKGTTTDTQTSWVGTSWTDKCQGGSTVVEYYCDFDNVQDSSFHCNNGCANGACKH